MTELFDIPSKVISALEVKGIDYASVEIAAKTDLDRDCVPCDNYIFVTKDEIIILGGTMTDVPPKTAPWRRPRLERGFEELSYDYHELSEFDRFDVEEMLSSARIVAHAKPTADSLPYTILIANLSNTFKSEAYKLVRLLNVALNGGDEGHGAFHKYDDDEE